MNIPQQQNQQEKPKKEWQFMQTSSIASTQSQSTHHPTSDVIGAIQLHQSHSLLATAGISRKIRLYTLLPNHHHNSSSSSLSHTFYISTPAKLSSLKFHPSPNPTLIAAADYDGVVTEYDLATKIPTSERDEHGGRRVWSIDYSPTCGLAASASDDCTAHLWDPRTTATASVVGFRAAACCVRFDEGDGGRYVAVGCADRCAYVYDVRRMDAAVARLEGHGRTVTYVRFAEGERMVTSSVDGCHRMWDLREGGGCVRAYAGHRNSRSFVGMDVCRSAGLIGCGSESNEVFVYDLRWGDPVWKDGFEERAGGGEEEGGRGFVSAVCWKEVSPDECVLFAAGSSGDVKMFVGKKKIECED